MSKENKTRVGTVIMLIIAALIGFFFDDIGRKDEQGFQVDQELKQQVEANKVMNIEQNGRITPLEQNEKRTYDALLRIEEKIDNLGR